MPDTDPRIADIVGSGRLRLALFLPQYDKDPASGALRGHGMGLLGLELIGALADRIGVKLTLLELPTPASAVAAIRSGACDVVFLGIEPSRAAQVDFTPAVIVFDYSCLVAADAAIRHFADVERPGRKIAVVRNHASTMALRRIAKHAELIETELPDDAFALLRAGAADAFAAPREHLLDYADAWPGARVLDDGYGINHVGVAVAQGRSGLLAYVSAFLEAAKASGLIRDIIARAKLRSFAVAPPAQRDDRPISSP